ncbi:MAG: DUF91 domain-containing protein [Anaerolineae bacterium]|nr:DUF91 domain-containing protein [Anaerolineae bacterium]
MPQDVKLWKIQKTNTLQVIRRSPVDLEKRIEDWLEQDISIISDDLLVIGRQVPTDFGGFIDLLCLDAVGDIVVVELKRAKTPREVTAQILDYASWVKDLSNERVTEIANLYFSGKYNLEQAFKQRFGENLPEILNEHHKMIVVASDIDENSERIINYLSETYGVAINATTFQHFCDPDGTEYVTRIFLIEPDKVEYKAQTMSTSKRRPPLTYEELQDIAENKGVGKVYQRLLDGLTKCFDHRMTTRSSVAFIGMMNGSHNTVFSIIPGQSNPDQGLQFTAYIERIAEYCGVERNKIDNILPRGSEEVEAWKEGPLMLVGYFREIEEVNTFVNGVIRLKSR